MARNSGRVVKNARLGANKYHVGLPSQGANGTGEPPLGYAPTSDPLYDPIPPAQQPYLQQPYGASPHAQPAAPPGPSPALTFAIDQVAQETRELIDRAEEAAAALLTDARDRAKAIIEDAAQRAETIVAAVRTAAEAEGRATGLASANDEMSEMLATMHGLIEAARGERHKLFDTAEPELVRLAVGIAERILHQQIALDRGVVVEMAKVAIGRLVDRETVTVRINPADLDRMRQHREELLDTSDIKNLRIVEDQRVDRGGVVIETDGGTIDARIGTQLNEAKRILRIEDEVVVTSTGEVHESNVRAARAI